MADPIVWADVLAHAPELSSATSGLQADVLEYVNDALTKKQWGSEERLRLARIYYAAHLASLAGGGGSGSGERGPITSESEGGVAVSYANTVSVFAAHSGLSGTKYGRLYLELRAHIAPRVGWVL